MAVSIDGMFPRFAVNWFARRVDDPWGQLVSRVSDLPLTSPERMAYTLTIRRLSAAMGPHWQHEHHGEVCALCAAEARKSYPGSDREVMALYYEALDEVHEGLDYLTLRRRDLQRRVA